MARSRTPLAEVITLESRRHEEPNSRRLPPPGDATPKTVDSRWFITDPVERTTIAHLRGWTHFGPQCPLCKGGA